MYISLIDKTMKDPPEEIREKFPTRTRSVLGKPKWAPVIVIDK